MRVELQSPSPFAATYERMLALGYHALPVMPGTKVPGEYRNGKWTPAEGWNKFKDTPPAAFLAKLWARWPEANVGVVLGTVIVPGWELGAIDFDTDDTMMLQIMESSVPVSPCRKRGRRGFTAFYLLPAGTKGRRFRMGTATICELLTGTATRQTILPPSIHPETHEPYVWLSRDTLANTPPLSLPRLTEDMLERFVDTVESFEGVQEARGPAFVCAESDSPHRTLNDQALADLDRWVPDLGLYNVHRTASGYTCVPHWRSSGTGRPLSDRSRNCGISRDGIRDFGRNEGLSPLDLVMAAQSWPLDDAFEWLAGRLGWDAEVEIVAAAIVPPHDPETGEMVSPPSSEPGGLFPDALTRPGGLLGRIIDWIEATAKRPNRTLALGAATSVLGTLMGRRVAGPTMSGTHLYTVALAPTGAGKDHNLRVIDPLLKAANAGHLVGPDEFMSQSAVVNLLQRAPLTLCAMDEIGAYLARIGHRKASPHEKSMTKILRTAWGVSFNSMRTPEWGARPSEEIQAPALSIYGVSTPAEFFEALQAGDVINGFLNRFLLLESEEKAEPRNPSLSALRPTPALAAELAAFYAGAIALTPADLAAPLDVTPKVIEWGAGGEEVFAGLCSQVGEIESDDALRPFYARTGEMAVRLATIRAAGRFSTTVDESDMVWGRDVALWSAARMATLAGEHMAGNEFAGYGNRIVRFMRKRQVPVTRREILQHMSGELRVKEVNDLMEMLVESGRVVASKKEKPVVGRPPTSPNYSLPAP
jgi:hypothetical protein